MIAREQQLQNPTQPTIAGEACVSASLSLIQKSRLELSIIKNDIDNFQCDIPTKTTVINWGSKNRGQGRRSGYMIQGSMSDAPHGEKKYLGIDFSKYKNDFNGDLIKCLDMNQKARYYKAREFGCNETVARLYAIS